MAEKKKLTEKESARKIKDLKIELLKNPTKRKSIKKEIARLLTMRNKLVVSHEPLVKDSGNTKVKLTGRGSSKSTSLGKEAK